METQALCSIQLIFAIEMLGVKEMFKDRKIKVQESIIADLKAENQQLKEELEIAKAELELKTFNDQNYVDLKSLIDELNKKKSIYEDLIQKANLARKEYEEKTKELNALRVEFSKKFKKFMKDIKSI